MDEQTAGTPVKALVLATYLAMITMNALANIVPIGGRTTGEVSENYTNLFAPTGLTFSIWGVIYLLSWGRTSSTSSASSTSTSPTPAPDFPAPPARRS